MSKRPYVQKKHEIEYEDYTLGLVNSHDIVREWLDRNGVTVLVTAQTEDGESWEMRRSEIDAIPEEAIRDLVCGDLAYSADSLKDLLDTMRSTNTGEFVYVDWF